MEGFTREEHPSYGLLRFAKTTSHGTELFGSSIKHDNVITLEIKHAELHRGLHKDWYHDRGRILEARMSYSQFAEAITSFNNGIGIPITLEFTEKEGRLPDPSFIGKREQFENEFSDHVNKFTEKGRNVRNEIAELFDSKKNIGKGDREDILKKIDLLLQDMGANTDFLYTQFNRQMDKTVTDAKMEVEAFVQNKMNSIAQAAIAEKLEEKEEVFKLESPIEIE